MHEFIQKPIKVKARQLKEAESIVLKARDGSDISLPGMEGDWVIETEMGRILVTDATFRYHFDCASCKGTKIVMQYCEDPRCSQGIRHRCAAGEIPCPAC